MHISRPPASGGPVGVSADVAASAGSDRFVCGQD